MGYLSQKKSQIRQGVFFTSASFLLALATLAALIMNNFGASFFNLFHLYLLSFILCIVALICKKFKVAVFFLGMFLINYIHLSAYANIFLPTMAENGKKIDLTYQKNSILRDQLDGNIKQSGVVVLSQNNVAQYVVTNDDLTIVLIDWDNMTNRDFKQNMLNLHKFIVKQNTKAVVFGDFGRPVWNRTFAKFLENSGLKVKNRLIFTKNSRFNIFTYPTFYVLGFENSGISRMSIGKKKNIDIQISFNPFSI